jgi:sec-independent protein translocase protein TatA
LTPDFNKKEIVMGGIGMPELLLIFGVAVLFFGGKKLPQLGSAMGETIRNFKKGVADAEKSADPLEKRESRIALQTDENVTAAKTPGLENKS